MAAPSDADESFDSFHDLVKLVLTVQLILIAAATSFFYLAIAFDFGFFWFSFLAGVFGSNVALLRRVQQSDTVMVMKAFRSWTTIALPLLYGGMMAAVAYFLFISQIISGTEGEGLLAMNLFPDFQSPEGMKPLLVSDWLELRPQTLTDAGKLMVWCFLAGYSESFVSGILGRLEQDASRATGPGE